MADLLIKGISDVSAIHDIHITNVGLNGAKKDFSAWDSSAGCAYEVVELPTHGELVDRDKLLALMSDEIIQRGGDERSLGIAWAQSAVEVAPTVLEASEDGE